MRKKKYWIKGVGKTKRFSMTGSVKVRMLKSGHGKDEVTGRVLRKGEVIKVSKQVADILEKHGYGKRVKKRKK